MAPVRLTPRPLAEIVQWLLQQHQQQRSVHTCPNDSPAAPQLLVVTESLRDRWRNDAATLESLRELTKLDLSACEISSFERCSGDKDRWASDKLSILLDCMPQLTLLDLRNSHKLNWQASEEKYRNEICDAGLLEAIGKLTSLQALRVGAVCETTFPDRRAAGREGIAVLAGALKSLTRLTELKLTVGKSLDPFEEGGEHLFGAIARLPALRILHMPVRRSGDIKAYSPAVPRSLAGALSGLKELADLNLQHHKFCLAGAISLVNALQSLPGLTHLRMGALEMLPAELGALAGLQTIGLSGCESLEELPAALGALTRLQEIDLSDCKSLKDLPAELGALKELQKINLSGCKSLKKLPAVLGSLTALREMNLSYCESLKELPAELGELKELQKINLLGCKSLEKLPAVLGGLTAQREMNLSFCESLKELPAELGELKELQKINLSYCKSLEKLPTGIGGLTALREIDLLACESLRELPAEIGGLSALWKVDLSGCESLKELPAELGELKHLQKINLWGCKSLEKLPAVLGNLTALREIHLRGCESLKELPMELGALTQLKELELEGCSALHTPPPHVVRQGTAAILEFLRDLAKGDAPCHLIKVVLLGNQRAGKSSLADSLVLGRPVTRADSDRTVGIEVRRWSVGRRSQLVANIYDAAGQRVYRATHGLFMSAGALFLHVVRSNVREDEAVETLLEWVEVVQQEAPGAVMGVVWTHIDCASAMVLLKPRVLGRVHEEINEQMQAVDAAMREMEDVIGDQFQDRGTEQGWDLCEKWMRAREQRDAALKALDQRAMVGCTAEDEVVGGAGSGGQSERATISEIAEVYASVVAHQHEMQVLEDQLSTPQSVGDGESLAEQLKRLRHKCLHRPRMLFSYNVSSRTGEGLEKLRRSLTALMENRRLFPHVGAKVPLNYSMLERLAQEGRTQASGGTEADSQPDADRAAWETAVTKHVQDRASDGLRNVCKKPHVRLGELEEEAKKVEMDKDEVLRALKFLHVAGSVLHYGSVTHRSSPELQNTVFMQPQFIIDAIKFVIREPSADNVDDEVRKNDARIRQRSTDRGEALDKYLGCAAGYGCSEGHGSGVLPKWLLTSHLWRDFDPQDHRVLLQLMMAFKLLRPLVMVRERLQTLSERGNVQYLVPAMLRKSEMPNEYVEPWWCPTKACAAAVKHADSRAPAKMRIVYQVQGGRLACGVMSELQVSLASLAHTESVDKELTSAPETTVVDRICGTVLSEAYTCGGGAIREWVIVSKAGPRHEQANGSMTELTTDCIRLMGWVELLPSSAQGATDWRLLRRIMREVEGMEQRAPALCLRKMALYVDSHGKVARALDIARQGQEFLRFTFEGGGLKQEVDVKRVDVIPSESWGKIKLVKPQACVSKGTLNVVDAFFAKRTDDHAINVHAEGQLMRRMVMDPGCGWDCSVNPQPTIEDLYTSISFARQRNVRVLHLSGHAREECGFIWNANDAATAHKTVGIEEISRAIGNVAGEKGPVECVVLNACLTEKMGRLLRKQGVPNVLCWNTPVQDETARDLVNEFYPALVEDKSGSRGYKEAFLAAVKKMGGVDAVGADTTVSGESCPTSNTTRNASPHASSTMLECGSTGDQEYGKTSQGGHVRPCQMDVVQFLSEDGDSGPFSLWRERLIANEPSSAPAGVGQAAAADEAVDQGLKALFVQNGLGTVCADVCRGLGVECLDDLKLVTAQDLSDELPKYVKEKLTLIQKRKLVAMIEGQRTVAEGVAGSANVAPTCGSRAAATAHAADARRPCIEGFFCKIQPDKDKLLRTIESVKKADASDKDERLKELESLVSDTVETIKPHKEEQQLKMLFQKSDHRREFSVSFNPEPTFQIFSDCMRTAAERNVRHLLLSGHGQSRWGFFWLKEGALEYEKIPTEKFVGLFRTEVAGAYGRGTIEGVVLNACDTEGLGKKLRDAGVPHVVCWRSEVYDSTASAFSREFFTSFEENKNYKISFLQTVDRIFPGKGATSLHKKHLHRDAVDYVCLLSKDGDKFLDTGHIRGRVGDDAGDVSRQRLEGAEAKRPRSPEDQEDLQRRKMDRHDFDHPSPSGGSGQLKRRREEDIIGQSSSTTGSEAVVQGGARQKRSAPDELLALFREKGLKEVLCESVCRKLGASTVEDLRLAQDSDVDDLKGTLELEPIMIRKLKLLVKEVSAAAHPSSSRPHSVSARVAAPSRECGAAGSASGRRIYAFFAKHVDDSINVHGEAENVMEDLKSSPWWKHFELDIFARPTFDKFRDLIRNCTSQNVVVVCFSGHAGEGGELCFVKDRDTMEMLKPDFVAPHIAGASKGASTRPEGGTIECVLLNACYTRPLGVVLKTMGVLYVVCWYDAVKDSAAKTFAEEFFKELVVSPTDYKGAFEKGRIQVERCDPKAASSLCFFSKTFSVDMQEEKERIKWEEEEAKFKARKEKDRLKAEKAAATKKLAEELAAAAAKAAKAAEEAAASSSESKDDEEETEAGAKDGDGDTEACRMANNAKGRSEMKGFKALGFTLRYNGKDIAHGIEMYEKDGLDGKSVREYGLEESEKDLWRGRTKVAGKKLLYIHKEALRQVFGDPSIYSYQDLWKVGGVVERAARRADSIARSSALEYLRESLSVRKGQAQESGHADTGHQQMSDEMEECIGRIEGMVREDSLNQSLKEGKTHKACGDTGSSNASKKSKGATIANPFALLGADDDNDGSEQGDE